ncbi:MAG: hypothetical protein ACXW0U_07795 [Halobacteriota archaeon]
MRFHLSVSLFNYLDRPIFDVMLNGIDLMGAPSRGFYGANSIMAMQPVTLWPQIVTWRLDGPAGTPRNGEVVLAKNIPFLDNFEKNVKWLGLHVFDDDTVEIALSRGSPGELQTSRGQQI